LRHAAHDREASAACLCHALQPSRECAPCECAHGWQQQSDAEDIGDDARREQEQPCSKDQESVDHRCDGRTSVREFALHASDSGNALGACDRGPGHAGREDEQDRRQHADPAADAQQQDEFEYGKCNEQHNQECEHVPAQHRVMGSAPGSSADEHGCALGSSSYPEDGWRVALAHADARLGGSAEAWACHPCSRTAS